MTTAVIAEACTVNRATLRRRIVAHCPEILIVGEAKDAMETFRLVHALRPELVFLDSEMPGMPGFSLAGLIANRSFELILTTDQEQAGDPGTGAAPWLVKPFGINALTDAVRLVLHKNDSFVKGHSTGTMLHRKNPAQRLALPSISGLQYLDTRDILYLEANSNYTTLYLTSPSTVLVSKSLKAFEDLLPEQFIRIHHSCIINKNLVSKYIRGEGQVQMKNGTLLAVARRKKEDFLREMALD